MGEAERELMAHAGDDSGDSRMMRGAAFATMRADSGCGADHSPHYGPVGDFDASTDLLTEELLSCCRVSSIGIAGGNRRDMPHDCVNMMPGDHVCGITLSDEDDKRILVELLRGAIIHNHKVRIVFRVCVCACMCGAGEERVREGGGWWCVCVFVFVCVWGEGAPVSLCI